MQQVDPWYFLFDYETYKKWGYPIVYTFKVSNYPKIPVKVAEQPVKNGVTPIFTLIRDKVFI
jgi:hypothetical protein